MNGFSVLVDANDQSIHVRSSHFHIGSSKRLLGNERFTCSLGLAAQQIPSWGQRGVESELQCGRAFGHQPASEADWNQSPAP